MPTIHIGFLDFTLFPEHPEFYATYKMMNVKNHHIFTDKLALSVVNLKYIKFATREDREWHIDSWASLFKATTWEELMMLAEKNPVMKEAAETVYRLTADEAVREQCKAREKYIKEMNTIVKEREMAVRARDTSVKEKEDALMQLSQKDQQIERLLQELQNLKERRESDL